MHQHGSFQIHKQPRKTLKEYCHNDDHHHCRRDSYLRQAFDDYDDEFPKGHLTHDMHKCLAVGLFYKYEYLFLNYFRNCCFSLPTSLF